MICKPFLPLLFLMLASCGFSPLYSDSDNQFVLTESAAVKIDPIPDYRGYVVVRALENKLNPTKQAESPRYALSVHLKDAVYTDQIIQENNFSTRKKITLGATYRLIRLKDSQTLIQSATSASGSYNIVSSPYATLTDQEKNQEDLLQIIADNISLHILTYFKSETTK